MILINNMATIITEIVITFLYSSTCTHVAYDSLNVSDNQISLSYSSCKAYTVHKILQHLPIGFQFILWHTIFNDDESIFVI